MFGNIFSEKHPVEGYITCGKCGKHINYHSPLATQVYCPNCWNVIDVTALKPEQIHPHKYDPETGKIIEFNEHILHQVAKQAVELEKKQIESNETLIDSLLTSYQFAKKFTDSLFTSGNDILSTLDSKISDKIIQDYIKYKDEYRKELGITEKPASEKEIQNDATLN